MLARTGVVWQRELLPAQVALSYACAALSILIRTLALEGGIVGRIRSYRGAYGLVPGGLVNEVDTGLQVVLAEYTDSLFLDEATQGGLERRLLETSF